MPDVTNESVINTKIVAVDADRTYMTMWNSLIPLAEPYAETVSVNTALSGDPRAGWSIDDLLHLDQVEVLNALDDTADPEDAVKVTETEPVPSVVPPQTPSRSDSCFSGNPAAIGGPVAPPSLGEDGSSGDAEGSSSEDCWEACVLKREIKRVKVANLHSDAGIESVFHFGKGRETETGVAQRVGTQSWQIAGSMTEAEGREIARGVPLRGEGRSELVLTPYLWKKFKYTQRDAGGNKFHIYEWRNIKWQFETAFEFSNNKPETPDFGENIEYKVEIPKGQYISRTTSENRTYEAGVTAAGLSLMSRAGFSEISRLKFTGIGSCDAKRWAYGVGASFSRAKVIGAKSLC